MNKLDKIGSQMLTAITYGALVGVLVGLMLAIRSI